MRNLRELREDALPGEQAAMKVPPRNRWQILIVEYELLDVYLSGLQQRVWVSGMVVVGLTMFGVTFLATMLDAGLSDNLTVIGLIGGVASLITIGWWLMLRRMFAAQRVAEYRRNEIERELGMRTGLYLTFLRQSRRFGNRRGIVARQLAEGDSEIEEGLKEFGGSPEGSPRFAKFMAERFVWNVVPWLLIVAWASLYLVKA